MIYIVYKPRDLMRRIFVLIILMICTMHAADAVRIIEFCPDPYLHDDPDEYLVIAGNGSLDGITISDGEGGFRFPPGSAVHGSVTIARSAPAFEQSHGSLPDFEWVDYSPIVPDVISAISSGWPIPKMISCSTKMGVWCRRSPGPGT